MNIRIIMRSLVKVIFATPCVDVCSLAYQSVVVNQNTANSAILRGYFEIIHKKRLLLVVFDKRICYDIVSNLWAMPIFYMEIQLVRA